MGALICSILASLATVIDAGEIGVANPSAAGMPLILNAQR
jgi:hypothetical protein